MCLIFVGKDHQRKSLISRSTVGSKCVLEEIGALAIWVNAMSGLSDVHENYHLKYFRHEILVIMVAYL